MKVGCTLAMLQCLDRPQRLAYVLGEILDMPAPEAADAIGLDSAAFRKRLQRAREAVEAFARTAVSSRLLLPVDATAVSRPR